LSFVEARCCVQALETRDELQWLQTSHILAMLHNVNVKKEHAQSFEAFNPYAQKRKRQAPAAKISAREIALFSTWQNEINNGTERGT
jgi:hypothetical protein